MGVVYRAWDARLERTIALKVILQAAYQELDERQRFQAEAMAVARLKHENIVQVYDVGVENDTPYMALEFVAGGTLLDRTRGKPQDPRSAARLIADLAD